MMGERKLEMILRMFLWNTELAGTSYLNMIINATKHNNKRASSSLTIGFFFLKTALVSHDCNILRRFSKISQKYHHPKT